MLNSGMNSILIYQDYTYNNGGLYQALVQHFGQGTVGFCDAGDILNGVLSKDVKAFFMPGGGSRYVADKLAGDGNQKIKAYVSDGGLYVGICAGAYYACRSYHWDLDGFRLDVENELGFFPGVAKGPIPEFAAADIVTLDCADGSRQKGFYWMGPDLHSEDSSAFEVVASFAKTSRPAIVSGRHGEGRYLLSSPHLEIDSEQLDKMRFDVFDNRYAEVAAMPATDGLSRDYFFKLFKDFIG